MQVGRHHHQLQDIEESLSHYQTALQLAEEGLELHKENAQGREGSKAVNYTQFPISEIHCAVGVAHSDNGQSEDALRHLKTALDLRKGTVGKTHPSVAECLNNLGALYFARGSLQKSVEHYFPGST